MKLQQEIKTTNRLTRDVEHLQWAKDEVFDMIYRSSNIEQLRQKMMSRGLH